jgi:L-aspartate oxidase
LARNDLQWLMTGAASVVRDADGLHGLIEALSAAPVRAVANRTDLEDAALTVTARTLAAAALARDESRGCHHRAEYPDAVPAQARSIVVGLADGDVCVETLAAAC